LRWTETADREAVTLSDIWLFHRERVLQVAGALLAVLSVAILVSEANPAERNPYETGQILGAATRNIVIGLVIGTVATYLWRRHYWLEDDVRLTPITPDAVAIAGVIALLLALLVGFEPGGGSSARASEGISEGDSQACFERGSPMKALPKGTYVELSDRQAARAFPDQVYAEDFEPLVRHYATRKGIVSFLPFGDASFSDPDYWQDFEAGRESVGIPAKVVDVAGHEAVESSANYSIQIATRVGCNLTFIEARKPEETRAMAAELLEEIGPA
jgi:hypothetical protein